MKKIIKIGECFNCNNKQYNKVVNKPKVNHKLALENMLESKIKRGYENQDTIMHSDQGIIYSSFALSQVHKELFVSTFY